MSVQKTMETVLSTAGTLLVDMNAIVKRAKNFIRMEETVNVSVMLFSDFTTASTFLFIS